MSDFDRLCQWMPWVRRDWGGYTAYWSQMGTMADSVVGLTPAGVLAVMERFLEMGNCRIQIVENVSAPVTVTIGAYFGSNDLPRYGGNGDTLSEAILAAALAAKPWEQKDDDF